MTTGQITADPQFGPGFPAVCGGAVIRLCPHTPRKQSPTCGVTQSQQPRCFRSTSHIRRQATELPLGVGPSRIKPSGRSSSLPPDCYPLTVNAQLFPVQKLITEQHKIAMVFETSRGTRASWTSIRINTRFPSMETNPFER